MFLKEILINLKKLIPILKCFRNMFYKSNNILNNFFLYIYKQQLKKDINI